MSTADGQGFRPFARSTTVAGHGVPALIHPGKPPDRAASWIPLGLALERYVAGDRAAQVTLTLEDGRTDALPASILFRHEGLPPAEETALTLARGRVLDIGAGAGPHALALQERGIDVVALDIDPRAVAVMRQRGVHDARTADIMGFREGLFDTVLLLMNGVGMAGDLPGLLQLLLHVRTLVRPDGIVLADAADLRQTDDPHEVARMTKRTADGRYHGEVRFVPAFEGHAAAPFSWLFVDPTTFADIAHRAGWQLQTIFDDGAGSYLVRLCSL